MGAGKRIKDFVSQFVDRDVKPLSGRSYGAQGGHENGIISCLSKIKLEEVDCLAVPLEYFPRIKLPLGVVGST